MPAYHCAQLSMTQYRTALIIFLPNLQSVINHNSDAVYWRGGDEILWRLGHQKGRVPLRKTGGGFL